MQNSDQTNHYNETIDLIHSLNSVISRFEINHYIDLLINVEPRLCYDTPCTSFKEVADLLKEFFIDRYPAVFSNEYDQECFAVFDQTVEECENKNIFEFHDKMIETTEKFLDEHIAPITDKHWPEIMKAMSNVQKYSSRLKIQTYDVPYKKEYVNIIYFTRNGKLIDDDFDPNELIKAYYTVDKLCNELFYVESDVDTSDLFHCTDGWFDDLEELIPEEQRDDVYPGDYVIAQYCTECNYSSVMSVFKYFDDDGLIEIEK